MLGRTTALLFFIYSFAACEPTGALCHESCEQDSDCAPGLVCARPAFTQHRCVPDDCAQCFEFGDTCFYDIASDNGGDAVCTFTACN